MNISIKYEIYIFSVDARSGKPLTSASHWVSKELDRKNFRFEVSPKSSRGKTGLIIQETSVTDRGEYICRVDFVDSPTRNNRIKLHVIGKGLIGFLTQI